MTVVAALRRTLELVESSQASPYATERVDEIAQRIRQVIAALESGAPVDRPNLGWLFAPTGAIQETSLGNGWGDEFLALAQVVDTFLANQPGRS